MYNFDTFNEAETKEIAAVVVTKLAKKSGKSEEDIRELAYQVGLFVLIMMQGGDHTMIVGDNGSHEVLVNPLPSLED